MNLEKSLIFVNKPRQILVLVGDKNWYQVLILVSFNDKFDVISEA